MQSSGKGTPARYVRFENAGGLAVWGQHIVEAYELQVNVHQSSYIFAGAAGSALQVYKVNDK